MSRLVLASASPRRRALLAALGLDFDVIPSAAEETSDGMPTDVVVRNACAKRDDVAGQLTEPAVVIGADTLVFLGGHTLGKPKDLDEARVMLARLSGRTHQVLTGLALIDTKTGQQQEGFEATDVTFRELTADEIDRFATAVNPVDRAGAYTVDGPGSLLVRRYVGCYQNVLGLPMVKLDSMLRAFGHSLFEAMDGSRSTFL